MPPGHKRRNLLHGIGAATAMGLAGCLGAGSDGSSGNTVTDAIREEPRNMNPYQTTRFVDLTALQFVVEPLLTLNDDFEPVPLVADDWEWGEEKKSITFTLKDLTFHDGSDVTSEDVAASLDRYTSQSPLASYLPEESGGITNTKMPSDDEITFEFAESRPLALNFFADGHTAIQPKSLIEEARNGNTNIGQDGLVGTGPYEFDEWRSGNSITLAKFEDYNHGPDFVGNDGPVLADEYVLEIVPEASTRKNAVSQGDASITFHLPPKFVESLEQNGGVGVTIDPAYGAQYMACNAERGPTAEEDVRVALAHAVDKEAIVNKAWSGVGFPIDGLITEATTGYWEGVKDVAYQNDLETARQHLDDAGWTNSSQGETRTKDGDELSLDLITFSDLDQWRSAGTIIQNQLGNIGVSVNVDTAEVGQIYDRGNEGDYHLIIAKNMWWFGPTYLDFLCHSRNIGSSNYGRLQGETAAEMDENLETAMNALSNEERQTAIENVQRIAVESAAYIPLASRTWRGAWNKSAVDGVEAVTEHPWWPALSRALNLDPA
ncbi:ABC transporter substrate-binding protein [Natrialba sp. PRR66]|uniref:ABC transporter substrate-binding protein n=1 Tax=Natrialba sp. PRR66 TaxID=3098146 RepID=UPI002B1E0CEC|nr:ABC transporter substrate-binding protein [Natrialba sp. PRR66]